MPIRLLCGCGRKLSVKDELAGRTVKCPGCGEAVSVPRPAVEDDEELAAEEEIEAPRERRRSTKGSGGAKRKKASRGKSGGNSTLVWAGAGGGGLVVVVIVLFVMFRGNGQKPAEVSGNSSAPAVAGNATAPAATPSTTAAATSVPGNPHTGRVYPSLPDAVSQPPEWLVGKAPFDVIKYFELPSADQNAAPLYLDAIFEFSSEVVNCFPDSPQRQQREQATKERDQRYMALIKQPRTAATAAKWDALLKEYEVGFQKMALAQQRPHCVFEIGVGMATLLPHVQGTRHIARMATERTRRSLENGDFHRPLQDVEMCLRLSRDLQIRRSVLISHLVGIACDSVCFDGMVRRILITPGLKPEHCDQLLTLLQKQEDSLQNPFGIAMQSEYLMQRLTMHQLQIPEERKLLAQGFGSKDDSIGAILVTLQSFEGSGQQPSSPSIVEMNLIAASIDWNKEVEAADEFNKTATEIGTKSYREGMTTWSQYESTGKFKQSVVMSRLACSVALAFQAQTRNLTKRHATQALIALRRWQLKHSEPPRDLEQVITDAGLKTVPRDNFGDGPVKLATVNRELVIYSIGPDGNDDSARVEWKLDPKGPGDWIFRMAPPE